MEVTMAATNAGDQDPYGLVACDRVAATDSSSV